MPHLMEDYVGGKLLLSNGGKPMLSKTSGLSGCDGGAGDCASIAKVGDVHKAQRDVDKIQS